MAVWLAMKPGSVRSSRFKPEQRSVRAARYLHTHSYAKGSRSKMKSSSDTVSCSQMTDFQERPRRTADRKGRPTGRWKPPELAVERLSGPTQRFYAESALERGQRSVLVPS